MFPLGGNGESPLSRLSQGLGMGKIHVPRTVRDHPEVMAGKPVTRSTRIPVETVLRKFGAGVTADRILADHPWIIRDHIWLRGRGIGAADPARPSPVHSAQAD